MLKMWENTLYNAAFLKFSRWSMPIAGSARGDVLQPLTFSRNYPSPIFEHGSTPFPPTLSPYCLLPIPPPPLSSHNRVQVDPQ